MKTLKTIMMALSLAAVPVAVQAQEAAAPAPATAAVEAPAAAAAPAAPAVAAFEHKAAEANFGQPIPGGWKLPEQVTGIGEEALWFHDVMLMPIIVFISLFVLGLLAWTMIRFRAKANPVPSRNAHNTLLEIIWTLVPVLILVVIAVPSIRLLAHQYDQPKPDLTIKVIGNQWFWTYQYPDNGDFELVSNMLKEKEDAEPGERFRTDADGPKLLAVDERVVVPVNAVVKVVITSTDVIHSWAIPNFWTKLDAVPGRLNETWFKAEREGVYYGQCSELCGARHGYMPIAVEVVSKEKFAEWVRSKGGKMPGEGAAAAAEATPAAATAAPVEGAPVAPAAPGAEAPAAPVTSQPATAQN